VYIRILNPIDGGKTHVSPKEAERLVYYGHASFVDGDRRLLRYLTEPEAAVLRQDILNALDDVENNRLIEVGRLGPITGEWHSRPTTPTQRLAPGGPRQRTRQYEMTLQSVAAANRQKGTP
jgi:hypothetical protein